MRFCPSVMDQSVDATVRRAMSGNLTDGALIPSASEAMLVPDLPKWLAARIFVACYVLRFRHGRDSIFMFTININGADQQIDGPPEMPLLWALRDLVGLTGTKFGCGIAQCGACTVQLDGQAIRSCVTPLAAIGSRKVVTIEAIGETAVGKRVQNAWLALQVPQCGYCLQSSTQRRGYRRRHGGQRVSVRNLQSHPHGHQASGQGGMT
jgi:hypothetical protein